MMEKLSGLRRKGYIFMQTKRLTFVSRILLTAALVSISVVATTNSEVPLIEDINDKINHFAAFFILSLLVDFSWPETKFNVSKILLLLGYGLAIEILQYFLPYRSFSLLDLSADAAGLFFYGVTVPLLKTLPPCKSLWKMRTDDTA